MNFNDYYIRYSTSSSSTNPWTSTDTSGGMNWPAPTRAKKAKKKKAVADIVAEMKKIAEEQEQDRINNLPKFDPKELDI